MSEVIEFNEFKKIDLRVAKIIEVEDIEGKDKLFKLKIDLGSEKRTLVAGVKGIYSAEQLKGKSIVVVANLKPAQIAGITSEGMLLAAVDHSNGEISLLKSKQELSVGSNITGVGLE
ncbi:methionine--tRNA ligase subunit beta [Candidatus Micrarchaeota archaeon]|nr:methionine--tRNA ligase subunit beta [Candidatus Micrarchaeota archaeon]